MITQRDTEGENTAYAVYGQGTWGFDNGLSVTVGGRYTHDERKAVKEDIFFPRIARGKQDYSRFSPSLVLEYQVSDDLLVYGKAVSGYKSGGYNLRAGSVEDFERGFQEEVLVTYELGMKSQWADNRVRLNAAVFRSDYDDIQVDIPNLFNPSQTSTFNAGKARIEGVELDLTVAPLENLLVNLTYGYLDANFTEVIDPQSGADITDDYVLPSAPPNGVNAGHLLRVPADGDRPAERAARLQLAGQDLYPGQRRERSPTARMSTRTDCWMRASRSRTCRWARDDSRSRSGARISPTRNGSPTRSARSAASSPTGSPPTANRAPTA